MKKTNKYKLLRLKYYSYVLDSITKLFMKHNRSIWKTLGHEDRDLDGEVLFELNSMHSSAIASSYIYLHIFHF